jgi:hypothetical protein
MRNDKPFCRKPETMDDVVHNWNKFGVIEDRRRKVKGVHRKDKVRRFVYAHDHPKTETLLSIMAVCLREEHAPINEPIFCGDTALISPASPEAIFFSSHILSANSIYSYDRAPKYRWSDRSRACGKIPVLTRNFPGKVRVSGGPRGRISVRHSQGDIRTFPGLDVVFWRYGDPVESEDYPPASYLRNLNSAHPIPATRVEDAERDDGDAEEGL